MLKHCIPAECPYVIWPWCDVCIVFVIIWFLGPRLLPIPSGLVLWPLEIYIADSFLLFVSVLYNNNLNKRILFKVLFSQNSITSIPLHHIHDDLTSNKIDNGCTEARYLLITAAWERVTWKVWIINTRLTNKSNSQ